MHLFNSNVKNAPYLNFQASLIIFIYLFFFTFTAEEDDFRQYCSSLFSVPVSKEMAGPQVSTSGLSLVIEDLDDVM